MKERKEEQLDLGLRQSFFNRFLTFKSGIRKRFQLYELHKYSRDIYVWGNISVLLALTISMFVLIFMRFSTLPEVMPILRIYTNEEYKLLSKYFIFAYPGALLLNIYISYVISFRIYERQKEFVYIFILLDILVAVLVFISFMMII